MLRAALIECNFSSFFLNPHRDGHATIQCLLHHERFHVSFFFFVICLLAQSFNLPLFSERIRAYNHLVGGCCKRKRFACLRRERNPFFLRHRAGRSAFEETTLHCPVMVLTTRGVSPPPVSAVALERFNERVLAGGRNKALATVTALL